MSFAARGTESKPVAKAKKNAAKCKHGKAETLATQHMSEHDVWIKWCPECGALKTSQHRVWWLPGGHFV